MRQYLTLSVQELLDILLPLGVFLATFILGYILRKIIFVRITRWAKNTKNEIDGIIIAALKGPSIIWFFMLGLYFALESSKLSENLVHIIDKFLLILGIFSITLVLANISAKLIKIYSGKKEFVDQYLIKHEFIKRLHERYAKEGIVIPYPIRAINYEQEKEE